MKTLNFNAAQPTFMRLPASLPELPQLPGACGGIGYLQPDLGAAYAHANYTTLPSFPLLPSFALLVMTNA